MCKQGFAIIKINIYEEMKLNILVVIPARGGSKGIPRKNLRSLGGKPLIYYSIKTALASRFSPDVYVSSDDDEILSIALQIGAKSLKRDLSIAEDATTLDPVVYDAYMRISQLEKKQYDFIITLQPTSPLLESTSLDEAIMKMLENRDLDTIIAAHDDTHLTWKKEDDDYVPNYSKRLNRQFLIPIYKETGGFLLSRSSVVTKTNRIGKNVDLYLLEGGENIDIDTYEDWNICEYYLQRKKVLFVVSGYNEIGLGHVYNTLLIANDILNHHIEFLVDKQSALAYKKIASQHYSVHMQQCDNIIDDIKRLSPQVVVNDRLNTEVPYMNALKGMNVKIINFEDDGEAATLADMVVNAIYPEKVVKKHHYYGYKYFLLRDEFLLTEPRDLDDIVKNVLITFGGTDSHNYTLKVIKSIGQYCQDHAILISVVAGFGYQHYSTLESIYGIDVHKNSSNIARHMRNADIVFTSAGRTTYEIASLQVPAIVMAQNERELTHQYASSIYGFENLSLGYEVDESTILKTFIKLVENVDVRKAQRKKMSQLDLSQGRKRTLKLFNEVVEKS